MPPTPQPNTPRRVDHRGVRIRAHQRIGERKRLALGRRVKHDARQILKIHLMADARIGRHDLEIIECRLPPAQEGVALDVAVEFQLGVEREGHVGTGLVHLHRVVDHQFRGQQRIHLLRIAAQLADRFAHRGQVHHGRNAREILQQHARRHERNFLLRRGRRVPPRQGLDILGINEPVVFLAQKIFEQHAERERQLGRVAHALFLQCAQLENFVILAVNGKSAARAERILGCGRHSAHVPF